MSNIDKIMNITSDTNLLNLDSLDTVSKISRDYRQDESINYQLDKLNLKSQYFSTWKQFSKTDYFFRNTFIPDFLIKQIPIIKYKNHYTGATDYIDGISENDMSYPIMKGVDCYRRPFICIKSLSILQIIVSSICVWQIPKASSASKPLTISQFHSFIK